jgi:dTDP-4-dehydrorhamnose reductase
MIWLIGYKGMLGREVEALLQQKELAYIASDQEIDITSIEELRIFSADKPISWIINCAAYTAVDKAEDEPETAFKINAVGPRNIAEIAGIKGAKLIHISTDYVFDGTKEGAYLESDSPHPLGVYGQSKYQGEINVAETLREYFIIRTAWLYGKQGNNFVYTMLRLFKEREDVRVVGDQWGSPTYAPDLAAVLLEIIRLNSDAYGIYNFTNAGRINWYDFAGEIHRIYNSTHSSELKTKNLISILTQDYPTKTRRPQNSYLSKDKITNTFNISPRNWKVALHEFLLG